MSEYEARNTTTSAERLEELSTDPVWRIIVASNPAAPANLLETLAKDRDTQVREQVASNPNTPWKTLEQLAWEFPHAFLSNPIGLLQIVAHPEQVSTDELFWNTLLQVAACPSLWWDWLLSHPGLGMSQTVRLHVQYAGETIHAYGVPKIGEERDLLMLVELLAAATAREVSLPTLPAPMPDPLVVTGEDILETHLQWLAQSNDIMVKQAVARNLQTPGNLLRQLAADQDARVRWTVASHPQTPIEVLQTLAQDVHARVRGNVASHPQTPVTSLQTLAQDCLARVRWTAASHPQTPVEALRQLAVDQDARVRWTAASHSHMPEDLLHRLARDENARVRRGVASHPQTPGEILQVLAQDSVERIRYQVALHPLVPIDSLLILAQEREAYVPWAVASHMQTPVEILRALALHPSSHVRKAVASHIQTPGEILRTLAHDRFSTTFWRSKGKRRTPVCYAVAENPQAPTDALHILAQHEDIDVRCAVAGNPQTSIDTLRLLSLDRSTPVRSAVARCVRTPAEILQMLALDKSDSVRMAIAENPQTPAEIRQRLSQDGAKAVQWRANLVHQLLLQNKSFLEDERWRIPFEEIERAILREQLGLIAHLQAPDTIRQTILTTLAANWSAMQIRAAFALSQSNVTEIQHGMQRNSQLIMVPFLPAIALQKLSASPQWVIRYLVALHEQTPGETRQRLSQDGNRYVRAIARAKAAQREVALKSATR